MSYQSDKNKGLLNFTIEAEKVFDQSELKELNPTNDNFPIKSEGDTQLNKSFLLNKFLLNSREAVTQELISKSKPPIPKPRKNKIIYSQETDNSNNNSVSSQKTYVVEDMKLNNETADVIVHNNPVLSTNSISSTKSSSNKCKTYIKSISDKVNISEHNVTVTSTENKDNRYVKSMSDEIKLSEENITVTSSDNKINEKLESTDIPEDNKEIEQEHKYTYNKIVEIIVHKTDNLLLDSYVSHPVVKVHIVDINSGKYYLKSNKNRSVVFYYENDEQDYILPVMTSSYNLQEKRTFSPKWEESILLNEDFSYIATENVVIFFEVLDYVPFISKKFHELQKYCYKGWHRITFAFLKLVGKEQSYINKKVKLQLYYPKEPNKREPGKCDLWYIWKADKLKKYPSALYITVKEVTSPKNIIETFRSKTPLQKENVSSSKSYKRNSHNVKICNEKPTSSRSDCSGNTFQLPNKLLAELDSYEKGCLVLKFSNNGLYLACAVRIKESFTVIIYDVNSLEETCSVNEHRGLIYTINWSLDDSLLLTSSADNTVVIWNFVRNSFLQILPHPIYVYGTQISHDKSIIATGCYDRIIRLWILNAKEEMYELHQEIEKHEGFVTSICFNNNSTNFYSSDSTGHIMEWSKLDNSDWEFERFISTPDLSCTVINQILLFANDKKLLVHSRDSVLRVLSVKRACVLYWLQGALNTRIQTFCSITPCGKYATCGSENGLIVVWDVRTGKDVMTYEPYLNHFKLDTVHCVQFNPKDDLIAFSHYGSAYPILLYHYNDLNSKQKSTLEYNKHRDNKTDMYVEKLSPKQNISFHGVLEKMDKLLH